MRFKYQYEHLICGLCNDITEDGCPHVLCPYIMENLEDLFRDAAFREAIDDAEGCSTFHRSTMIFLKKITDYEDKRNTEHIYVPFFSGNSIKAHFKQDCDSCVFPAHGFVCYDEHDGSCLKDDIDAIARKEKLNGGHNR